MSDLVRRMPWPASSTEYEPLLSREWLVTNGLGGYAAGTVSGVITRRYHGLLIAGLPAPLGRVVMLNGLSERLRFADGTVVRLGGEEVAGRPPRVHGAGYLKEFRLEAGLPVWRYEAHGIVLEKRLVMPHMQNTVHVTYRLLGERAPDLAKAPSATEDDDIEHLNGVMPAPGAVRIELQPIVHFRLHESPVNAVLGGPYVLTIHGDRFEMSAGANLPALRMLFFGEGSAFTVQARRKEEVFYRIEKSRGYEDVGELWSPGYFHVHLAEGQEATLVASTEGWETVAALCPADALAAERVRRADLLSDAHAAAKDDSLGAELVLAADQFIITPAGRVEEAARARAAGNEVKTVIAGYHWFTDWGRDTMISLEGLTLVTGRHIESRSILTTFAHAIKDGLIPNMFPERENEGLYHTVDATLWFFHAIDRYLEATSDRTTLRHLLPKLVDIVDHHLRGTRFGIGVDPKDGLLRHGEKGYQLTWMDAKVGDWVVTPRAGKAVETNALWYNALRLLSQWVTEERGQGAAAHLEEHAERARKSFNERFWYEEGGYLYDVLDGEQGNDTACRPNQVLSISPRFPVLDQARWEPVMQTVRARLLTPVGLRSLAPGHRDYKATYDGDLRSRDAAYHQGTVWAWLIGPFIDAWLKVHPEDRAGARGFLEGFAPHMDEACIGQISEIFDAEAPYTPRGCVAQAWSVAEVLRCLVKTAGKP
jgi:predicted glycogen debranching enzyme